MIVKKTSADPTLPEASLTHKKQQAVSFVSDYMDATVNRTTFEFTKQETKRNFAGAWEQASRSFVTLPFRR